MGHLTEKLLFIILALRKYYLHCELLLLLKKKHISNN